MTSNFCKTSWHPYGHTPEECPDCRLCHESKIPKKLEFRPHLTTGVIARDRDMEILVLWLNELRDYLQAKEESKQTANVCYCCKEDVNKASKGECYRTNKEYIEQSKEADPPEHEETIGEWVADFEKNFGALFENNEVYANVKVKNYIRDNFVSKSKIKREIMINKFKSHQNIWNAFDNLLESLGLGD